MPKFRKKATDRQVEKHLAKVRHRRASRSQRAIETEVRRARQRSTLKKAIVVGLVAFAALVVCLLLVGSADGQDTLVFWPDSLPDPFYSGAKDAHICSGYPTFNYGAAGSLLVGRRHIGAVAMDSTRALLQPDLSAVPPNASVSRFAMILTVLGHPATTLDSSTIEISVLTGPEDALPRWGEGDNAGATAGAAADTGECSWNAWQAPDSAWSVPGASGVLGEADPWDHRALCDSITIVYSDSTPPYDLTFELGDEWLWACYDDSTPTGIMVSDYALEAETCTRCASTWSFASSSYSEKDKRPRWIVEYEDTVTARTSSPPVPLGPWWSVGIGAPSTDLGDRFEVRARKTTGIHIVAFADPHASVHGPGGSLGLTADLRTAQVGRQFGWISDLVDAGDSVRAVIIPGDFTVCWDWEEEGHGNFLEALQDSLDPSVMVWEALGNHEPDCDGYPAADTGFAGAQKADWGRRHLTRGSRWGTTSYESVSFTWLQNVRGGFDTDTCYIYANCHPEDDGLHRPGSSQHNFVKHLAASIPDDVWKIAGFHCPVYGVEHYSVRPNQEAARTGDGFYHLLEGAGFDLCLAGDQHVGCRINPTRGGNADSAAWAVDSPLVYLSDTTTVYMGIGGARARPGDAMWWPRWYWDEPPDSVWRSTSGEHPDSTLVARGFVAKIYQGCEEYDWPVGEPVEREADTLTYVVDLVFNGGRCYGRVVDVGFQEGHLDSVIDEFVLIRDGGNSTWSDPPTPRPMP